MGKNGQKKGNMRKKWAVKDKKRQKWGESKIRGKVQKTFLTQKYSRGSKVSL